MLLPPPPAVDPGRAGRAGLAWGLLAVAIWAGYSVLARLALTSGLSPADLTLLRFAPGALLMAPMLVGRWGLADLAGIGWRRGFVLAMLSGPGFSLLIMSGFALAPLVHGVVIAPACQMLAGLALSARLAGQPWTRESAIGAACVVAGLALTGGDGLLQGDGGRTLLGDALFAAAGCCWGLYGALARRWRVDALRLTGVAVVLSFALFAPPFLLLADLGRLAGAGAPMLALQTVAQGLGAGLVAVLAFNRAVELLGSGQAAFFGAMVPVAASLLAIPVLGEVPTALQFFGIVAVVAGLLIAFGALRLLLGRRHGTARAGATDRDPDDRAR